MSFIITPQRRTIIELSFYVTYHFNGVANGQIAAAVTEGREMGMFARTSGTSCVELPDCTAFAAGCREANILRDEHHGFPKQGRPDLGWFIHGSKHSGRIISRPRIDELTPGDYLGMDFHRGGHAAVFLGMLLNGRALTGDYGQPGGKQYECRVERIGNYTYLRGRRLDAAVDVDSLKYTAPALTVREWCEQKNLPDPGPNSPPAELIGWRSDQQS